MDRKEEATELYGKVLAQQEKELGRGHIYTLKTIHNLAFLYSHIDRREEAVELYREALAQQEKVLGCGHPSTLTTMQCLASSD